MNGTMRNLVLLIVLAASAFTQIALAQMKMSAEDVVKFVRSSLQLKQSDREVAAYLRKIKLTNRLSDREIEELQGAGATPRIVEALRILRDGSSGLPDPEPPKPVAVVAATPSAPQPPAPDSQQQAKVLAETREYAINYSKKLPDFICAQITRRYYDPTGREDFRLADKINEQLTFFEQRESYKVSSINGKFVTISHDRLDGASSSGEFGSLLKEIFAPETQTDFQWERWATLRGRRMHVFSFRVAQSHSQYGIVYRRAQHIIAGYHGSVYVDRETGAVMRFKFECDGIPADFPIQQVSLDMNYDFQKISDTDFVLPLKAELRSRESKFMVKNEVEFRLYRKFGADTTIKFDAIDPLPEEATKEQPATPAAPPPATAPKKPSKKP